MVGNFWHKEHASVIYNISSNFVKEKTGRFLFFWWVVREWFHEQPLTSAFCFKFVTGLEPSQITNLGTVCAHRFTRVGRNWLHGRAILVSLSALPVYICVNFRPKNTFFWTWFSPQVEVFVTRRPFFQISLKVTVTGIFHYDHELIWNKYWQILRCLYQQKGEAMERNVTLAVNVVLCPPSEE